MRSLFTKIFVSFWLALILVAATAALLVRWLHQSNWRQAAANVVALRGEMAIDVYVHDGPGALRAFMAHAQRRGASDVFVFGPDARELAERPVDPELAALAARAREADGTLWSADQSIVARIVSGVDGRKYVALGAVSSDWAGPFGPPPWVGHGPPDLEAPAPPDRPPPSGGRPRPPPGMEPPVKVAHDALMQPTNVAILFGAVALVGGAVCFALARHFTGPLARLRSTTRRLAAGDLSARVGAAGRRRDEIAALAHDFDEMAGRIDTLVSAQQRLLRDISHELRSPLARVGVALELARGKAGPAAAAELDRIELECTRLNELIGQLLNLARLEGQGSDLPREAVELSTLTSQVVDDANFEAAPRRRSARMCTSEPCRVSGHAGLLRSAIENVVRNALYYAPAEREVEVRVQPERSAAGSRVARVSVRDYGAGVPTEQLADLFRPFYRVNEGRDRASGGVGLGLAITQRAVLLYGGTITAANAPGGGLIVELTLPMQA